MTNEEAKHELDMIIGDGNMEFVHHPIRTELFEVARTALEKQIPKKPHWTYPYKNNTVIRGPFCGRCKKMYLVKTDKYCDECGQAIDWAEE